MGEEAAQLVEVGRDRLALAVEVLDLPLLLVVFVGEAIREAFDPREYSRLR